MAAQASTEDLRDWLTGRLPEDWFTDAPEVVVDRDEITIVGRLDMPTPAEGTDQETRAEATEAGRIRRFREETRRQRMAVADELEARYGRKTAWGAVAGSRREVFTNLAVPTMTRLRQPERRVLDTLIDAGVARTRAEALQWCVRLVGQHEQDWLERLREALSAVETVRAEGPRGENPPG
ncbi:MAG TPA: hypothetical protein VFX33_01230 [Actinomycetales bacterium]|nr:hypothetical protein [Actinomycetales bacterium]